MKKGTVFVISAPSGAGKTTLLRECFKQYPSLIFSISCTTRAPRPGEEDGRDYYFCNMETFRRKIDAGELAEWKEVHGNLYGTLKQPILNAIEAGRNIILDIDVYGKMDFDSAFPENIGILIVPPSIEALESRLRKRGTDSPEVIHKRVQKAEMEMNFADERGNFQYTILNDTFEQARTKLLEILEKEGCR